MIEATIRTARCTAADGRTGTRFQLVVTGSMSAAADPARTAVCALVQSLTCQLARADWRILEDFDLDGVAGSGWCAVTALPTAEGFALVQGAFGLASAGFALLARQFPGQLRLITEDAAEPRCG